MHMQHAPKQQAASKVCINIPRCIEQQLNYIAFKLWVESGEEQYHDSALKVRDDCGIKDGCIGQQASTKMCN